MTIREPAVSGQFYPASPEELKTMIRGMIDEKAVKEDIIGYYAPHAGYIYSGPVVGATVSRVNFKDTCVILGPAILARGAPFSILTDGAWRTPLGDVQVDTELGKGHSGQFHSSQRRPRLPFTGTLHRVAIAFHPVLQAGYQICADRPVPH